MKSELQRGIFEKITGRASKV